MPKKQHTIKMTRRPSKGSGRSIPLRSYTSVDPLNACTPPSPDDAANSKAGGISSRSKRITCTDNHKRNDNKIKKSKSIKFKAKDFCRQIGGSLDDEYSLKDALGQGAFGEVYACIHKTTGAERAVKVLAKSPDEQLNDEVRNEFQIVKDLDHPNLIKVYHLFESMEAFHIVFDLIAGGDLLEELERVGRLQEEDAAALMNHLLSSVNYIHSRNVCHRDLKPENILLSRSSVKKRQWNHIKLIDFGLAKTHSPQSPRMTDIVGTPYYMAPQVLDGSYTSKADVWSLGVIAFLVLGGYAPFDGESMHGVMQSVHTGVYDFEDAVWEMISEQAKDFVRYLLTYNEDQRPTALEALQHPWLVRERQASDESFRECTQRRTKMSNALESMQNFDAAESKLKQATCALLTSQLLTKEEREEIDSVFRILDADCSGQLTKDEVQKGFAQYYNKTMTDEEIDNLFMRVNFSQSGEIEYSEFVCACLMETDLLDEKRLRAAFAEFDLDGSGSISVDELKEVFAGCTSDGMVDEEMIDAIIEQVDTNRDGEICFMEFQNLMRITAATQPTSREAFRAWTTRAKSMMNLGAASSCSTETTRAVNRTKSSAKSPPRRFLSLRKVASPVAVAVAVADDGDGDGNVNNEDEFLMDLPSLIPANNENEDELPMDLPSLTPALEDYSSNVSDDEVSSYDSSDDEASHDGASSSEEDDDEDIDVIAKLSSASAESTILLVSD